MKIIHSYRLVVIALVLTACSGEPSDLIEDDFGENPHKAEEMEADTTQEQASSITDSSTVENTTAVWQIDDYATFLIDESIADSPSDAEGFDHYYTRKEVKKGYAKVEGAIEGFYEFALWRMTDGDDLVGKLEVGCGPVCSYESTFYKGKGNELKPYDQSFLFPLQEMNEHKEAMIKKALVRHPTIEYHEDSQLIYNMPVNGTGMRVDLVLGADELRIPLLFLSWDGSAFSLKTKYTKV